MREAFEKWMADRGIGGYGIRIRPGTDDYIDYHTSESWAAWQAAYRAALEDAAKVCEKEIRVMGQWESMDPADYDRCDAKNDAREDCAAAIRGLTE
jgi:hypothetical protein